MILIHNPVAEKQFCSYSALLDLQERLKIAEKGIRKDSYLYQEAPEGILEQTEQLCRQIAILLDIVRGAAAQAKTPSVEDRGYKAENRGVWGSSKGGCCGGGDCNSGGCNSGGCGSNP